MRTTSRICSAPAGSPALTAAGAFAGIPTASWRLDGASIRIPITLSPAALYSTVQYVLHKYSEVLRHALHDADQAAQRELCCTPRRYAGCVPRVRAAGRAYAGRRTSVGPEFATSANGQFLARRDGGLHSGCLPSFAANPPFLSGT